MGLEDAMGDDLDEELGTAILAMEVQPSQSPPAGGAGRSGGGSGGGGARNAGAGGGGAPGPAAAPPPPQQLPPARPTATLQRLLAQLATVRRQMHEANGGQGEVFNLAEHMAPPLEAVKPKIA